MYLLQTLKNMLYTMCVCICGLYIYIYIYIYYANDDSFTCATVFVFGCDEYIFCYLFIIFTLCVV